MKNQQFIARKIKSLQGLLKILKKIRQGNRKVIFTNGCFDILHKGHIAYLAQAKDSGGILIVGLNSDNSVRRLKGKSRPIVRGKDRAIVLSALSFVDFVVIFNSLSPIGLIKKIRPDALIKGGDWKIKDIVGADFVKSYGGVVKSLPYIKGFSTNGIIKKINETAKTITDYRC